LLVPPEGTLLVVAVGDAFACYDTHWDAISRTKLWCSGHEHTCRGCRQGWPSSLDYYLEVLQRPTLRRRVLAVPERGYKYSVLFTRRGTSLRGLQIACGRMKRGGRAPVQMNLLGRPEPAIDLPPATDLRVYLSEVFGLK
jgi:hypothetical protein